MNEIQRLIHEMCPDGVPMVALGEVCDKITDGSHNPPSGIDYSSYRMISSQNIFNNKLVLNDIRYLKEDDFLKENKRTEVSQGDLLLTIVGAIGRCYVVKEEDLPFTCQRSVAVLKIKQSIILPEFVHECLININSYLETQANGAAQKGLYLKQISKIQIPLPPLPIQQRIVEILDKFTSLVSSLDSEIALRQKQYEYYRDELLSFEEGDFEWKTLTDISTNCDRLRKPITSSNRIAGSSPYYGASGIVDYVESYIFDGNYLLISEDGANLLARSTPIAFSIEGKNWVNNHAHVLKFDNMDTQRIVELYLNSIDLTPWISGAAQPKLNQDNLNKIPIPIPPLDKQRTIVRTLDTFESLLTNLKKERELRQKQYEYYREKLLTFA